MMLYIRAVRAAGTRSRATQSRSVPMRQLFVFHRRIKRKNARWPTSCLGATEFDQQKISGFLASEPACLPMGNNLTALPRRRKSTAEVSIIFGSYGGGIAQVGHWRWRKPAERPPGRHPHIYVASAFLLKPQFAPHGYSGPLDETPVTRSGCPEMAALVITHDTINVYSRFFHRRHRRRRADPYQKNFPISCCYQR